MPEIREIACYGCGALVPSVDGPLHRYIGAAAGCWAAYGEVLARRYSGRGASDPDALLVNAYAVQHPGRPSAPAIQSVVAHLIGLYLTLEGRAGKRAMTDILAAAADGSARYHWLSPPTIPYATTIRDVRDAPDPLSEQAVTHRMATETWAAWAEYQPQIRDWAAELDLA